MLIIIYNFLLKLFSKKTEPKKEVQKAEVKVETKEFKSLKNKFLRVNPDVILTDSIDKVIYDLDSFFRMANKVRFITSGKREPKGQLQLIINYVKKYNIPTNFVAEDVDVRLQKTNNYVWLEAYSQLLVKGVVIAPSRECKILYDYKTQAGDIVKAGTTKIPSSHFLGTALDIGGGQGQAGEEAKTIDDEITIVEDAIKKSPNLGIISLAKERENNCLHVNVKLIQEVI